MKNSSFKPQNKNNNFKASYKRDSKPYHKKSEDTSYSGDNKPSYKKSEGSGYSRDDKPRYRKSEGSGYSRDNRPNYKKSEGSGHSRDDKPRYRKSEGSGYSRDNRPNYRKSEDSGYSRDDRPNYRKSEGSGYSRDDRPSYKKNKHSEMYRPKPKFKETYEENSNADNGYMPEENMEHIIYGRNSVMEALKGERTIEKIFTLRGQNEGSIIKILGIARRKDIVIQEVEKTKLDELSNGGKHQGIVAYVATHEYSSVQDILDEAKLKNQDPFIVILDGIQDPYNLGAIIRTAHNAGAHGVIIPKHRAVGLTSIVSKASAGAIEYMKIARATNIAQTIAQLKKANVWVACANMDGKPLYKTNLKGAIAVVIGNEGSGVSQNIKSKCDFNVSIPMYGQIASLNASVACAIICYEIVRQVNYKIN